MAKKRKHRKVKGAPPGWKGCKCPKNAVRVSTCGKSAKVCKGRGWGCLGVGTSKRGKPVRRFVKAICGPVQERAPQLPAGRSAGGRGGFLKNVFSGRK